MYDNIPYDKSNPFHGKLYHRTGDDSPEVYHGIDVDYRGNRMTLDNFKKLLLGESTGKAWLNSTKNDNVFMFYSSGGTQGSLEFASTSIPIDFWRTTLKEMYNRNRFQNLLIFATAADSIKAFQSLPTDLPILAIACHTSSNMYCPSKDNIVHGKHMNVCLGTELGVRWNEVAETRTEGETIENFSNRVQSLMNETTIEYTANTSLKSKRIDEFIGILPSPSPSPSPSSPTPSPTTSTPTPPTPSPTPTLPPTLPPTPSPSPTPTSSPTPTPENQKWIVICMWIIGILLISIAAIGIYACTKKKQLVNRQHTKPLVLDVCYKKTQCQSLPTNNNHIYFPGILFVSSFSFILLRKYGKLSQELSITPDDRRGVKNG